MERLTKRYETAVRALENFKEGLDDFKTSCVDAQCSFKEYRKNRDSLIKRFELSLDTLWKYLKLYLQESVGDLQNSPKPVFRECLKSKLLTEAETVAALEMVNARNNTAYVYQEEVAEQILAALPQFYVLMKKLADQALPPG